MTHVRAPVVAAAVFVAATCLHPTDAAVAQKRTGAVAGPVRNLPSLGSSTTAAGVRLVRADSLEIAAAATLAPSSRYRLRAPKGLYVSIASMTDVKAWREYTGRSRLFRIRKGRRVRVSIRAKRVSGSRRGGRLDVPRRAVTGASGTGAAVSVSPQVIVTTDPELGGASVAVDGPIITVLSQYPCPDGDDLRVVEERHRKEILEELRRQRSRWFDPKSRVTPRLIKPRFQVRGGGVVTSGEAVVTLQLVDLKTGQIVASETATGEPQSILDLLDELARRIAEELCGKPKFDLTLVGTQATNWSKEYRAHDPNCGGVTGTGSQAFRFRTRAAIRVEFSRGADGEPTLGFPGGLPLFGLDPEDLASTLVASADRHAQLQYQQPNEQCIDVVGGGGGDGSPPSDDCGNDKPYELAALFRYAAGRLELIGQGSFYPPFDSCYYEDAFYPGYEDQLVTADGPLSAHSIYDRAQSALTVRGTRTLQETSVDSHASGTNTTTSRHRVEWTITLRRVESR